MMDEILTLHEAAERVKVQPGTVRTWLQHRKLPGIKAGKEWRVRASDLEAFIEEAARVPLRLVAPPPAEVPPAPAVDEV